MHRTIGRSKIGEPGASTLGCPCQFRSACSVSALFLLPQCIHDVAEPGYIVGVGASQRFVRLQHGPSETVALLSLVAVVYDVPFCGGGRAILKVKETA